MFDLAGYLGWLTICCIVFAFMNFVVIIINKNIISKLSPDKKKYVDFYRTFMKFIIKNHKFAGVLAFVFLIAHFVLMFLNVGPNLSGFISMIFMFIIVALGIYGAYFNKNTKALWLKLHKVLATILIVFIVVHLLFPYIFM